MSTKKDRSSIINILSRILPINSLRKQIRSWNKDIGYTKDNFQFNSNSYSQYGEDILVEKILNQLNIDNPFYVDIGAHHPTYLSNTHYFYLKGCRGINIEPNLDGYNEFLKIRPDDVNIGLAINVDGKNIRYYMMKEATTLNTTSKEECDRYIAHGYEFDKCIEIEAISVKNLCENYIKDKSIDFLSLDIEGHEEQILLELFKFKKPKVLCVETFEHVGEYNNELVSMIIDNGYKIVYSNFYYNKQKSCNSIFMLDE